MSSTKLVHGDYVLATKYRDGDTADQWCIGFYDQEFDGRHYVVDAAGRQMRPNGFRRAAKISREIGDWLLSMRAELDRTPGINLWEYLADHRPPVA